MDLQCGRAAAPLDGMQRTSDQKGAIGKIDKKNSNPERERDQKGEIAQENSNQDPEREKPRPPTASPGTLWESWQRLSEARGVSGFLFWPFFLLVSHFLLMATFLFVAGFLLATFFIGVTFFYWPLFIGVNFVLPFFYWCQVLFAIFLFGVRFGLYHSLFEWYHPLYLQDKVGIEAKLGRSRKMSNQANNRTTRNFVLQKMGPELKELIRT